MLVIGHEITTPRALGMNILVSGKYEYSAGSIQKKMNEYHWNKVFLQPGY